METFVWWFIDEISHSEDNKNIEKLRKALKESPKEILENIRKSFEDLITHASMSGIPVQSTNTTPEILLESLQKHFQIQK